MHERCMIYAYFIFILREPYMIYNDQQTLKMEDKIRTLISNKSNFIHHLRLQL